MQYHTLLPLLPIQVTRNSRDCSSILLFSFLLLSYSVSSQSNLLIRFEWDQPVLLSDMACPMDSVCSCVTVSIKDSLFFKPRELNLPGTGSFRYKYALYVYNIAFLPHGNAGELKQYNQSQHIQPPGMCGFCTLTKPRSGPGSSPSPSQSLNGGQISIYLPSACR